MKVYHGSKKIVSMPFCDHKGNRKDFGKGFYATESEIHAREWAAADENGGFLNIYELDTDSLEILDLCGNDEDIFKWLALILSNRILPAFSPEERDIRDDIIREHLPDIRNTDVIKGYRADDSIFSFCRAYIRGDISADELAEAVRYRDDGEEVLLRTERAFENLEFISYENVDGNIYYPARMKRDISLRLSFSTDSDSAIDRSYPRTYLDDAMRCLGELAALSAAAAPDFTEDSVLRMFIASGYASRFETGDPFITGGMSGAELLLRIIDKCGLNDKAEESPDLSSAPGITDENRISYECGRLLACYQWYSSMPFAEIISAMSFARLISIYEDIRELPLDNACAFIDIKIRERASAPTRLQACRKRLGLSQKELAAYSGVNLRTLQQYETGDKDINRAAADKVNALSRALYCSMPCVLENHMQL